MRLYLLVVIFAFSVSFVNGQSILPHDESGKILFTESVKVDSADSDVLYRSAKTWVLENFTNLKQILKKDDNAAHEIILRGSGECYAEKSFGDTIENGGNSYTLKIQIENGGYTYSISDFVTTDKWKGDMPSESVKGSKKQMLLHEQLIYELAATLTASLKKAMASKIVVGME